MTKSIWASRLGELGFEKVAPERQAVAERHYEARRQQLRAREPNREAKRAFDATWERIMKIPTFGVRCEKTLATDETGQLWTGPKNVDLSVLGFKWVRGDDALAAAFFGGPADYSKINN